jgi:hypothetical protein
MIHPDSYRGHLLAEVKRHVEEFFHFNSLVCCDPEIAGIFYRRKCCNIFLINAKLFLLKKKWD